jgi:uncharacterized coiled-coil DUF342 family protein
VNGLTERIRSKGKGAMMEAEMSVMITKLQKENDRLGKIIDKLNAEKDKERDAKFLSASNPYSGWQGINKECKLWQERAEEAEAENTTLKKQIQEYKDNPMSMNLDYVCKLCDKHKAEIVALKDDIKRIVFDTDVEITALNKEIKRLKVSLPW